MANEQKEASEKRDGEKRGLGLRVILGITKISLMKTGDSRTIHSQKVTLACGRTGEGRSSLFWTHKSRLVHGGGASSLRGPVVHGARRFWAARIWNNVFTRLAPF
ncbi:hypothetical protein L484_021057 [Morus notabilis]|uniref:Uncharacterized protein n=1 Tax=Morus notabilis TaxID=981085 RepID=W9R1J4_9ROSA|nr:hypothetical protein L484_021057 [Morus notabilis]